MPYIFYSQYYASRHAVMLIFLGVILGLICHSSLNAHAENRTYFLDSPKEEILILGKLNHSVIAPMVIDTGASCVAVNQKIVDLLQLKPSGTMQINTALCHQTVVKTVIIPSITIGDTTVKNIQAVVLPQLSHDVLLGINFFKNKRLTIDFNSRSLTIENPSP